MINKKECYKQRWTVIYHIKVYKRHLVKYNQIQIMNNSFLNSVIVNKKILQASLVINLIKVLKFIFLPKLIIINQNKLENINFHQ
jgi:hypothetical protein